MRLGNFCVISHLYHKYAGSKEPYGTLMNMAPEVFEEGEGEGDKSDVWSLGMVVLELALKRNPFAPFKGDELRSSIQCLRLSGLPQRSSLQKRWTL